MNLKALITTLVLGSSSMASADSISLSGSVSVSLGNAAPAYRPAPSAPAYRPAPSTPVAADDCHDEPVYQPVPVTPVYHPTPAAPVWQAPIYRITNTTVSRTGSVYKGTVGTSKILKLPPATPKRYVGAHAFAMVKPKPTQAWFDLTEATRIDSGREFFTIGAKHGLFNTLQLQALGNGNSRITQVLVEYADSRGKTSQVFKLNNQLINRTSSTITLDLDGEYRSIKRIVVYGATDQGSAFKLLAK